MKDYLSGYELCKLINVMLDDRGIKNIPPQMIYNYMSKGYIKTVVHDNRNMIELAEAEKFAEKYVAKKMSNKS